MEWCVGFKLNTLKKLSIFKDIVRLFVNGHVYLSLDLKPIQLEIRNEMINLFPVLDDVIPGINFKNHKFMRVFLLTIQKGQPVGRWADSE